MPFINDNLQCINVYDVNLNDLKDKDYGLR